jgi:prepilin-type N-terminal cleavage/methylation domain-containing protein/prepilin-type processing-associated H-X9-DG protein
MGGFTLIELMVVMAVIALLIAVLLPALSTVRGAARRTTCVNNLKQIGLALQQYELAHGVLPPGSVNASGPILTAPEGYHHGWYTMLLPYLDAGPLSAELDASVSIYDDRNAAARSTPLPLLFCPSDTSPRFSRRTDDVAAALTNYAGNHHPTPALIDVTNHGVLFLNSRVRYGDMLDGSSHTIFVGEFTRDPHDLGWASGTFASLRNSGAWIGGVGGAPAACGFSSHHDRGSNFCFGDGSVQYFAAGASLEPLLDRADEPETMDLW